MIWCFSLASARSLIVTVVISTAASTLCFGFLGPAQQKLVILIVTLFPATALPAKRNRNYGFFHTLCVIYVFFRGPASEQQS